jgi:FKBP-type peptidyl-prolyl cis-trans isomerase 2
MTVGVEHPHLRGLGLDLVGVTAGEQIRLSLPPNQAYGPHDPNRIRRLSASRFSHFESIPVGRWVSIAAKNGRLRAVKILEVRGDVVVIDTNRRGARHWVLPFVAHFSTLEGVTSWCLFC